MLENIWKAIRNLTKNVKLMTIITIITAIFGAIQLYFAFLDHKKDPDIVILKNSINKRYKMIDSIYKAKKNRDELDEELTLALHLAASIKSSQALEDYSTLKGKNIDALTEYIFFRDGIVRLEMIRTKDSLYTHLDDLFYIWDFEDLDSIRKNRSSISDYGTNKFLEIEDAMDLKEERRKYHMDNLKKHIKNEDTNGIFDELNKWNTDMEFYKYDDIMLDFLLKEIDY